MSIGDLPDPAIVAILDALVAGDYEAMSGGADGDAELFRQAVAQYGLRLIPMDEAVWDRTTVYRTVSQGVMTCVTEVTLPDEYGYGDLTLNVETVVDSMGVPTSRAVDLHVL